MNKDDVLRVAKECGIAYYLTPHKTREMHCIDSELERFATAMYAAGAEGMREQVKDVLADRQTGAEAAFESDKTDYWEGRMDEADFCLQAIRALPIATEQAPCDRTWSSFSYDLSTNTAGEQANG